MIILVWKGAGKHSLFDWCLSARIALCPCFCAAFRFPLRFTHHILPLISSFIYASALAVLGKFVVSLSHDPIMYCCLHYKFTYYFVKLSPRNV